MVRQKKFKQVMLSESLNETASLLNNSLKEKVKILFRKNSGNKKNNIAQSGHIHTQK